MRPTGPSAPPQPIAPLAHSPHRRHRPRPVSTKSDQSPLVQSFPRKALRFSPPALRGGGGGEMPKAEGGCGPDSPAWLYLARRARPPLSLRDISPRSAGGEGIRPVQSIPRQPAAPNIAGQRQPNPTGPEQSHQIETPTDASLTRRAPASPARDPTACHPAAPRYRSPRRWPARSAARKSDGGRSASPDSVAARRPDSPTR